MKLIWTKSNMPISVLIRSITGEDCSHFAFVFNTRAKGVMFESNFLGTHIKFFESSKKSFEIVHELNLDTDLETEEKVWNKLIAVYDGKRYDFGGAIYLGICILAKRLLRFKLPEKNIWADPKAYFCDEVYEALYDIEHLPNIPVSNGMQTPYDVWLKVKGAFDESVTVRPN